MAGPLNLPRTPQGRPVLVQAGSSEVGRRFAARHAEAVFTAHLEKETAQAFYADLKRLAAEEAVLDARPGTLLVSLGVRYMRAFRGTATATASFHGDLATIELRADDGKLGSLTTARLTPLP